MTLVLLVLACGLIGVLIEQALTFTQRRLGRQKPDAERQPEARREAVAGRQPSAGRQADAWQQADAGLRPEVGRRPVTGRQEEAGRRPVKPAGKRSARPAKQADKRPAKRAGRKAAWPNQVEVVGPPIGPADSWPGLAPVFASAPDLVPVPEPAEPPAPTQRMAVAPDRPEADANPTPSQPPMPTGGKSELATQQMVPEAAKTVVVPLPVLCGKPQGPVGRSPRGSTPKAVAMATEKTSPEQTVWTAVTGRVPRVK